MTTSSSRARLGKAAAALLALSISLVVHAGEAMEATPPKPANEASTASTDKATVGRCKDAWDNSSAAQTCVDLDFAMSGDICTISVICVGTGGASNRQTVDVIYSSVRELTNQKGTLTGGKRPSKP